MGDKQNRGGASRSNQDLDREPEESTLPVTAAIGVVGAMFVCCLGTVLLVSGGSGLVAWLGGFDPLLAVGIAVAIFALVVVFRRLQKTTLTETERAPRSVLKGDQ